ncbi:MAG TPA: hypothetical protein VHX62_19375 [Solirubrobacteraceae bacterium]|nr:hypothetical protein [Solirubrobacteraceae bacterium]
MELEVPGALADELVAPAELLAADDEPALDELDELELPHPLTMSAATASVSETAFSLITLSSFQVGGSVAEYQAA